MTTDEEIDALKELQEILTPDFAYGCYVAFYHLMGRAHLDMSIPNLKLLKLLCSRCSAGQLPVSMLATFAHLRPTSGAGM